MVLEENKASGNFYEFMKNLTPEMVQIIVNSFHTIYYYGKHYGFTWGKTSWLGTPLLKCPLDMWLYQEIIFDLKPDIIVETGTAAGGSALFLASICDLIKKGKIITIDIEENKDRPEHQRIQYLLGSSTSSEIISQVQDMIKAQDKVMVILDSDHSKNHVLGELKLYSQLVTSGSFLIVEDTNLNGHPVLPEFGPGPMEALEEFLKENQDFTIDNSKDKFFFSFNPKGFLLKK